MNMETNSKGTEGQSQFVLSMDLYGKATYPGEVPLISAAVEKDTNSRIEKLWAIARLLVQRIFWERRSSGELPSSFVTKIPIFENEH